MALPKKPKNWRKPATSLYQRQWKGKGNMVLNHMYAASPGMWHQSLRTQIHFAYGISLP
jgi:hypothetical protein